MEYQQKDGYMKMLDDQKKQGRTVLDQQKKYQKDYLAAQTDAQKKGTPPYIKAKEFYGQ